LVVVGDVGLNRSQVQVDALGILEGGSVLPWEDLTVGIRPLIAADLAFMNLESVVTDRNDLSPEDKGQKTPYLFRSHPRGVEHLADVGFNLVSAANNHAFDYGASGVLETIAHLSSLQDKGKLHFAGIGNDRDAAARPNLLSVRGIRIAFSAIGIVTNNIDAHRAKAGRAGTLGYRFDDDWKLATEKLAEAPADLRILSIHYGTERDIRADARQLDEWRWATRERSADVVIGHHAHVVRGIELHHGRLIFYGLGNFLIRGARDMRTQPAHRVCCDYGLLAKVHLKQLARSGDYRARAIEVVPIVDMHRMARPWDDPAESKRRIEVLNVLAERLDDEAADSIGVRFQLRENGTGLWCAPSAKRDPAPIGSLCKTYRPPGPPSPEVVQRVEAATKGNRR
jgi:poly-gamma-glutamate synthesis protein (capsule biosynthesis protein)